MDLTTLMSPYGSGDTSPATIEARHDTPYTPRHRRDVLDEVAELMHRASAGDNDAFATLYARYYPTVLGFLRRRAPFPGLAEDLAADTFLRAFISVRSFEWRAIDPAAWLCAIARNRLIDHHRSAPHRHEICTGELPDRPAADDPEAQALDTLGHDAVIDAINLLPETQRECLTIRFVHQRSIADTARLLGRSESAVKQIQIRASRKLKRNLTHPADRRTQDGGTVWA